MALVVALAVALAVVPAARALVVEIPVSPGAAYTLRHNDTHLDLEDARGNPLVSYTRPVGCRGTPLSVSAGQGSVYVRVPCTPARALPARAEHGALG